MSGLGVASGDGTKALVNRAVPVAVVALALIGIGRLVLHLVVPEPQRLCYQPPCPQPIKPMAGVWTIAVALALALVVGIVVVRRVRPVLAAIAVAVPGLILLVLPVPRLWAILQAVQADPGLILQERRAGVGPLDPLAVVIGLALLGCSVLCHLGGRGLSGRGLKSSGLSPRWPEAAWLGTAIAALLLGLVPIVGELAVTYPLLQGQYVWQSWMPDQGTPMSGGARDAALLLLVLTGLVGLVVAARLRAARAVWGVQLLLGLAAALALLGVRLVFEAVAGWQQTFLRIRTGPFVAEALPGQLVLAAALVVFAVLGALTRPRA